MSLISSDKPCYKYSSHCASSRINTYCTFCGIDTFNFSKEDWDNKCPEAIKQNIQLKHNYRVEHIRGQGLKGQDYNQIIYYKCLNCNDTQVRRDI
jgi:hypothetical protein